MSRPACIRLVLALVLIGLPSTAFGQRRRQAGANYPQPQLLSVSPAGLPAGGSVDVTLQGNDLDAGTTLWFDHPGLRAFHLKGQTFRIVAATGTPVGHHDIRAVNSWGVSNPRTLVVGDRPESREAEPNNIQAQASPIPVNSTANGEINPATDVDFFTFEAKKGQRLLLEIEAERIDSQLDPTLHLLDAAGREIGESRDAFGADPFLDATIPADGAYVIKVHDVIYRGSANAPYRLTLTDGPHIDAVVPSVARAGESGTYTLVGRNLGGEPSSDVAFDGRPLERKTITLTAPSSFEPDTRYPSRGHVSSFGATRRGFEVELPSTSGTSNPAFIAEATDPVVVEHEPNDDAEHAQTVESPCTISGLFNAPGDVDLYRFRAKKGDVFQIEAAAERFGSPADPSFAIQKVNADGKIQELTTGDDTPEKTPQTRFPLSSVDASVKWTAPDDGLYQIAVSDLFASQRGDVRLVYRLSIRPERPDFSLFLVPDSPDQPDALTLPSGGRALAYVAAMRVDGFAGPIEVEALDLPPGVRCEPVTIPGSQTVAPLVLEADAKATRTVGSIRLVGRARHGDRKDAIAYVPGVTPLGPDVAHEAVGGGVVWPVVAGQQGAPVTQARLTRGFVIAVVDPAPLALTAEPRSRTVTQGSVLALDLSVARDPAQTEPVAVSLASPLPGLDPNAGATTIAKGSNTGLYSVTIPTGVAPGVYNLVLQGNGPFPFAKDPNAKTKPNVPIIVPSNAVRLTVRPATAKLAINNKGGALKAGGTLEIEVTATPVDAADKGPWPIELVAPQTLKLSAKPVMAEPGKPVVLAVSAAADGPAGAAAGAAVRITAPFRGEPVANDLPLTLTLSK